MQNWIKFIFLFLLGLLSGYGLALLLSQASQFLPLITLIVSSLIGVGIPAWNTFVINTSRLSIEIYSIERNIAKEATVDLRDYDDLNQLASVFEFGSSSNNSGSVSVQSRTRGSGTRFSNSRRYQQRDPEILGGVEDLEYVFSELRKRFEILHFNIDESRQIITALNDISPENFSGDVRTEFISKYSRFFRTINPGTPLPVYTGPRKDANAENTQRYNKFNQFLRKQIDALEEKRAKLQAPRFDMQDAKETVNKVKQDLYDNESKFSVLVSLVNSGRLSTSVRVPAILRIYIAKGTYVNLELKLANSTNQAAEIPARSTKVIVFESAEVSKLPEDARKLVNEYWKNNVYCALFLVDVRGEIYKSSPIVFASGVYQKMIVDRLANAAATYNPWLDLH